MSTLWARVGPKGDVAAGSDLQQEIADPSGVQRASALVGNTCILPTLKASKQVSQTLPQSSVETA